MPAFSQIESLLPPDAVVVPPDAFSSTWSERPDDDVSIGLRFVPDRELEDARIEAFRRAERLFPKHATNEETAQLFAASFQGTLIRWVIARGTCDPNNVHKPWHLWATATEDIVVEMALTDHGAQLIYDAWERMRIGANIGLSPATDADLELLPELLLRLPLVEADSRTRALRLRRLLRFVLEELEAFGPGEAKAPPGPTSAEQSTPTEGT